MANIKQYTDKIRTAVYGKEVRGSLADGIETINTEVEANTKHVNDTVDDIKHFKDEVSEAEVIRVNSENSRIEAEKNRVNNENTRNNNEATRVANENTRKSNEEVRASSESTRNSNENLRKKAEEVRAASEIDRINNENVRKSKEETRVANENTRKFNEETRINSEKIRISNEELRNSNESNRTNKFTELDKQAQGLIVAMKQIVGNIDDRFVTKASTRLENVDFNTVTTGGFYATVKNTEEHNAPGPYDGRLFVIPWNLGAGVAQMFFEDGGKILYRIAQNNEGTSWTEWKKINNLTPTDIGAVSIKDLGNWSFNNRDIKVYNKRAMVGCDTKDGDKLYINYENDFKNGVDFGGLLFNNGFKIPTLDNFKNDTAISGFQKLPNGLILQWGKFSGDTNQKTHYLNINVPFTFAFPAKVINIFTNVTGTDQGSVEWACDINTNAQIIDNKQFKILGKNLATNWGARIEGYWFAIGH